jgi:4-hydroxy-3-polyprenylbenzoate decarboxylase
MSRERRGREERHRLIVGITGASGAFYAIRLLEILGGIRSVETHLVVSAAGSRTISLETDIPLAQVAARAHVNYTIEDVGAAIASGSFRTMGMIVLPCSIKTLSGIANSYSDNLLLRAADVTLKERRPLILSVRETPLHLGHVRLMLRAAEMGAILAPPMPAFYSKPASIQEIVDQHAYRLLDLLNIDIPGDRFRRWQGG